MSQWISLVANVGVFVGFILIAYQIQQNNTTLLTSSVHNSNELFSNSELALMGDTGYAALTKALDDPGGISKEELMQVWSYLSVANYSAVQVYDDYKLGVISKERWLIARDTYISYINHPVGLIWWKSMGSAFENTGNRAYFDAIEEGLSQTPENLTQIQFRSMLNEIKELEHYDGPDA